MNRLMPLLLFCLIAFSFLVVMLLVEISNAQMDDPFEGIQDIKNLERGAPLPDLPITRHGETGALVPHVDILEQLVLRPYPLPIINTESAQWALPVRECRMGCCEN